jgi:uncharacterized membrane protein
MASWRELHLPGPHHTPLGRWHHDSRWRLLISILLGCAGGWLAHLFLGLNHSLLIGWSVVAVLYCLISTIAVRKMTSAETSVHARSESPGRVAVHIMLLVAAGISLVGLVVLLFRDTGSEIATAIITLVVVSSSWFMIQVMYALRYAREYYRENGGIDFNQSEDPQYSDFAYLAFTIGMSFATSDPNFTNSRIRKIALSHALLNYVFGTIILAAVINILASLSAN